MLGLSIRQRASRLLASPLAVLPAHPLPAGDFHSSRLQKFLTFNRKPHSFAVSLLLCQVPNRSTCHQCRYSVYYFFAHEGIDMTLVTATTPLILGRLAIYAPDLQVARQVYARVSSCKQTQAFGTVVLDSGDEVDWVDMVHDVAAEYSAP